MVNCDGRQAGSDQRGEKGNIRLNIAGTVAVMRGVTKRFEEIRELWRKLAEASQPKK